MLGLLVRRAWAQRSLVAAVLFTVTLTSCALTALAAYGEAVADAGLRRVLQDRSASRTLLEVEADIGSGERERLDALVRDTARDAYDGLPVRVHSSTGSAPYQLPPREAEPEGRGGAGPEDGEAPRLTLLAAFEASRVDIAAGERPGTAPASGAVPVAVHEAAARALALEPGDRMTLADRRDGTPLEVRVTGVYRPADRGDPYWRLDPLAGRGVRTVDFTTYGPLLVEPSVFSGGRVAPATVSWQVRADFSTVTADRADRLRDTMSRAVEHLADASGGSLRAATGLPGLLAETEGSLLVSRSAVLVGAAELALLAGCVLVLVSGALYEPRAGESALLRARGATARRLAALAVAEALLSAVPAAVVAAWAAGPLAELTAEHGPLALAGVHAPGPGDGRTWAVAAASALGCAAALTAPALRRRGSYVGERAARIRRPAVGAALRAGADVGLLAVAVVAYLRVARYADGGASGQGGGLFGADPVLVLAPACCLLAGAVSAVRLLPAAVRAGRRVAARSRGLVAAAAHWQLSRRPGRAAGPMLLGVLAVATVTLTAGQGASWDRSQRDRADHAAGADLRVTGSSTPAFGQGGVYGEAAGIAAATPVARERVTLPGDRAATLLAMDTGRAAGVVRLRPDLADAPADRLYAALRPAGRGTPGIALPADTRRLRLTARLRADGPGRAEEGAGLPGEKLRAVFRDRYGVPHTFSLGELPADGEPRELEADFAAAAGPAGAPAGPLSLVRLSAGHPLPDRPVRLRLTVTGLRAVTAGGTTAVDVPPGAQWESMARVDDPDFRAAPERGYVDMEADAPAVGRNGAVLDVRYGSGAQPEPPRWENRHHGELTLRAAVDPGVPAAVATDAFLAAQGAEVGETTTVELLGTRMDVRIAAAVRALPTTSARAGGAGETGGAEGAGDAGGGALLMDLAALEDTLLERSARGVLPAEWWLAAEPGQERRAADALRARPDGTTVVARGELARELASDPLGAGPRSALTAVALAAAVLALAGFAVASVGALRERADDIAVLRALGAPRVRIAASVAAEQGFLAAAAVGLGALTGVVLARLIVPLTVVTARGGRPEPDVTVVLPGWLVPVLAAVVAAVPVVVSAAAVARRGRPAAALRRMED